MTGTEAMPRRNDVVMFDEPWQGRAVALAVETVQSLGLPWDAFRQHLTAAIAEDRDRPYYGAWVLALERLVAENDVG